MEMRRNETKSAQLRWSDAVIILTTITLLVATLMFQVAQRPADFLGGVLELGSSVTQFAESSLR